jgi:hypothetical protein
MNAEESDGRTAVVQLVEPASASGASGDASGRPALVTPVRDGQSGRWSHVCFR